MVDIAGFFERLGGALIVLFCAFIIVPILLAMASPLDAVGQFFVVIACFMIFIGAIVYIAREKQYS
jgi:hypothetical protein